METNEGMKLGAPVTASEAPSTYHVATTIENEIPYGIPVTQAPPPLTAVVAQASIPSTFSTEKKKRGRPRKLDGEGPSNRTLSPRPLSVLHPPTSGNYFGDSFVPTNSGNWVSFSSGVSFLPHMITVNAGEDVATKIASLSQQGARAIFVMSANGVISNVTIRHSSSSRATLTYEGRFQILSLNGSCTPPEVFGESWGRNGEITISLASNNGHVVAGLVAGALIAAAPVEVMVGSFLEPKPPRKRRGKNKVVASPATTSHAPIGGEQNVSSSSTAPGNPPQNAQPQPGSSIQDSTMFTTDTNLSLGRED